MSSSRMMMMILFVVFVVVLSSAKAVTASAATDDYVYNPVIIDACPAIVKRDPSISIDERLYLLSALPQTLSADSLKSLGLGAIQYVKGVLHFSVTDLVDRQACIKIYSDVLPALNDVEVEYSARNFEAVDLHFKTVATAADSCAHKIQDIKEPLYLADETHDMSLGSRIILAIIQLI